MPEVPYRPFPTVTPVSARTARIDVAFPHVPFTKSIGQALGNLGEGYGVLGHATESVGAALASTGKDFKGAGDELFQRALAIKHIENQTAATDAHTQFMMRSAQMESDFQSKQGNAASGGLDAYMKGLTDERAKMEASLPNQQAQYMFHEESMKTLGRAIFYGAHHAKQQGQAAYVGALEANEKMILNDIANNPDAPDIEDKRTKIKELENNIAETMGEKKPAHDFRMMTAESKIVSSQVSGLAKKGKFEDANNLLNTAKKENRILAADAERVENTILGDRRLTIPRVEADRINNDLTQKKTKEEQKNEPTLQQRLEKGDEAIEKAMPGDQIAKDFMRQRVTSGYREIMAQRKDNEVRNYRTVDDALMGGRNPEGRLPTKAEELWAQGDDVRPAFEDLDPKDQRRAIRQLARNAEEDYADSPEAKEIYMNLKGAASHLSTQGEFLDTDILALNIPWKYRKELRQDQLRLAAKAEEDPRVNRAMQILGDIVPSDIDPTKNKDAWKSYRGRLSNAMSEMQRVTGKPVTPDEIKAIGRMLNKEIPKTGFFHNYREFEIDPKAREQLEKAHPDWDEAQIGQTYIRGIMLRDFNKLYQKYQEDVLKGKRHAEPPSE